MATACNDDGAHRRVARDLGRARPDNELTIPPDPLAGLPGLTLYPLADPLDTNQPVRTAFLPAIRAHLHGVGTRTVEVAHEQFIGTMDFASRHCARRVPRRQPTYPPRLDSRESGAISAGKRDTDAQSIFTGSTRSATSAARDDPGSVMTRVLAPLAWACIGSSKASRFRNVKKEARVMRGGYRFELSYVT